MNPFCYMPNESKQGLSLIPTTTIVSSNFKIIELLRSPLTPVILIWSVNIEHCYIVAISWQSQGNQRLNLISVPSPSLVNKIWEFDHMTQNCFCVNKMIDLKQIQALNAFWATIICSLIYPWFTSYCPQLICKIGR